MIKTNSDEHAVRTDVLLAALAKSVAGHVTRGRATLILNTQTGEIRDYAGNVLHPSRPGRAATAN